MSEEKEEEEEEEEEEGYSRTLVWNSGGERASRSEQRETERERERERTTWGGPEGCYAPAFRRLSR